MKNGTIDTSKMTLVEPRHLSKIRPKDEWIELYLDRVIESNKRVTKRYVRVNYMREWNEKTNKVDDKPSLCYYRFSTTSQKFLCVGGEYAGKLAANPGEDYKAFNRAHYSGRGSVPGYKVIYVHKSLLGEKS